MVDLYLFILVKDFNAVKEKVCLKTEHVQINYHYEWSQHKVSILSKNNLQKLEF